MSSLLRTTETDNDGGGGGGDDDVDDLFTSLGGILMKELLADLTMDDDFDGSGGGNDGGANNHWLNLEQLEMELRQYERSSSSSNAFDVSAINNNNTTSVAGWLVNQPSQPASVLSSFNPLFPTATTSYGGVGLDPSSAAVTATTGVTTAAGTTSSSGFDAWSLSFQKFTASSLEEDFLLADSHRKQQQQQQQQQPQPPALPPGLSYPSYQSSTTTTPVAAVVPPPGLGIAVNDNEESLLGLLRTAEEYDTTEQPRLPQPPPGLSGVVISSTSSNRAVAAAIASTSTSTSLPGPSYPIIEEDIEEDAYISSDVVLEVVKEKLEEGAAEVEAEDGDDDNEPVIPTKVPKPLPPTPHNSIAITSKAAAAAVAAAVAAADEPPATTVPKTTTPKTVEAVAPPKVTKILARPQDMEPLPRQVPPPKSQLPPPPPAAAPAQPTPVVVASPSVVVEPTAILQRPTAGPPPQQQPATGPAVVVPVVGVPIVGPHQPPPGPGMIPPPNAWQTPLVQPSGVPMPPPGGGAPLPPHFGGGPMPPPPPGPSKILFCNPHYNASPVPATIVRSRFMKPRDITYVVHGILKSIIFSEQGQNPADRYDIQYYQRHIVPLTGGPIPPPLPTAVPGGAAAGGGLAARPSLAEKLIQRKKQREGIVTDEESKTNEVTSETEARRLKAKEWSQTHAVLGHTTKTDVTRPRALIAVTPASLNAGGSDKDDSAGEQQRQRAALWKARIYIDQGYQAYRALTEIWRDWSTSNSNSVNDTGVPPAKLVQPHLVKLFKCFGISGTTITPSAVATTPATTSATDPDDFITEEQEAKEEAARAAAAAVPRVKYSIDSTILQLVCKLPKGKMLVARVLEQGLLPPPVVHVLLPAVLGVLVQQIYPLRNTAPGTSSSTIQQQREQADSDDRIFRILTRIIQSITDLHPVTIVTCCTTIQENASTALSSTTRMQCTHALLHRGSLLASSSNSASTTDETKEQSESFQNQWTTIEQSFLQILSGM